MLSWCRSATPYILSYQFTCQLKSSQLVATSALFVHWVYIAEENMSYYYMYIEYEIATDALIVHWGYSLIAEENSELLYTYIEYKG